MHCHWAAVSPVYECMPGSCVIVYQYIGIQCISIRTDTDTDDNLL